MVRFVNSGTEATMSAIRLARAATGRDLDRQMHRLLPRPRRRPARPSRQRRADPRHPVEPRHSRIDHRQHAARPLQRSRTAPKALFEKYADQIACFVVEPIAGNMGLVPPAAGYLQGLRDLCTQYGALLLFDEVMTGFRVAWGGRRSSTTSSPTSPA